MSKHHNFISGVLAVKTDEEARAFYKAWCVQAEAEGLSSDDVRWGIGYCFVEGMSPEQRAVWVRTCAIQHPFLGTMEKDPTPREAYEAGRRMGEYLQRPTSWDLLGKLDVIRTPGPE